MNANEAKELLSGELKRYFSKVSQVISDIPVDEVNRVLDVLLRARNEGRCVYVFGNGGSATAASHLACDLGKGTIVEGERRLKVISLTDNISLITAWANDTSYQNVFAQQLANLVLPGDIVIGISSSGNSPNVLAGIEEASKRGAMTIGLTGVCGKLREVVDLCISTGGDTTGEIEDAHMVIIHAITAAIVHASSRTE